MSNYDFGTALERIELSDGSVAFNIVIVGPHGCGHRLRLACVDERHARALADQLDQVCWAEVASFDGPEESSVIDRVKKLPDLWRQLYETADPSDAQDWACGLEWCASALEVELKGGA